MKTTWHFVHFIDAVDNLIISIKLYYSVWNEIKNWIDSIQNKQLEPDQASCFTFPLSQKSVHSFPSLVLHQWWLVGKFLARKAFGNTTRNLSSCPIECDNIQFSKRTIYQLGFLFFLGKKEKFLDLNVMQTGKSCICQMFERCNANRDTILARKRPGQSKIKSINGIGKSSASPLWICLRATKKIAIYFPPLKLLELFWWLFLAPRGQSPYLLRLRRIGSINYAAPVQGRTTVFQST